MYIETMLGLGDNIYLRPVIKWLPHKNLKLITPWPQVYYDLDIEICKPIFNHLRTQQDNVRDYKGQFSKATLYPSYRLSYKLDSGSIIKNYCDQLLGFQPTWFDCSMKYNTDWTQKAYGLLNKADNKPICLIRPNTIRKEWPCYARNPKSEYLQRFIDKYKDKYQFISLANIKDNEEYIETPLDNTLELLNQPIEVTFGLFQIANLIVTSPSFWVAVGMEMHKRMLIIYGAHEEHFRINDIRVNHNRIYLIEPKPFDRCDVTKRDAFKDIDDKELERKFQDVEHSSGT